jgi:hypothetical protein
MRDESDHWSFSQISLGRMRGMVETDQTGVPNLPLQLLLRKGESCEPLNGSDSWVRCWLPSRGGQRTPR